MLQGVALTLYGPVLSATYGLGDDYPILLGALRGDRDFLVGNMLGNGRPGMLAGLLVAFEPLRSVADLRWLRLLTVVGIAAVGAMVLFVAMRAGRRKWSSFAIAVAVMALPSYQITAAWSLMFVVPPAVVASMWAAWRVHVAAARGLWSLLVPAAALSASALTYQPAAMAYWLTIAILATGPSRLLDRPSKLEVRAHALVLAIAGMLTMAVWICVPHGAVAGSRSSLGGDPESILRWFVGGVLPRALLPLSLQPLPRVAAAIAVLACAGLYVAARRRARRPVLRTALLLGLLPLAHAPALVAGPDVRPTYRSMVALAPVVLVLMIHAAEGLSALCEGRLPLLFRALPILGLIVPLVLAVEAPFIVHRYIARPQEVEYDLAISVMRRTPIERPVVVYTTRTATVLARTRYTDEFGHPTSWYPWAAAPMLELARHDRGQGWGAPVRWIGREEPAPREAVVVDFDRLLRSAGGHS